MYPDFKQYHNLRIGSIRAAQSVANHRQGHEETALTVSLPFFNAASHAAHKISRIEMLTDALLKEALLRAFLQKFHFKSNRFQALPAATELRAGHKARLPDTAWRAAGRQVMALHEAYTGGGQFSHQQNPLHRHQAGYQFYFLPRNVFRIRHVLESLPWRDGAGIAHLAGSGGAGPHSATLDVLDLGCGTGAFSLALLENLAAQASSKPLNLRIALVDQGRSLLELAQANIRAYASLLLPALRLELQTHTEGVEAYLAAESRRGHFGIVGGGMMLNEMALLAPRRGSKRAVRFVTPLMHLPRQGGLVIFVEPGTRKGYMNLMALRDHAGRAPILYPCPHDKPCPVWSPKVHRWCHATQPLPAKFVFDGELRSRGRLEFAMREINLVGLAFQQSASGRVLQPFFSRRGARVVSGRLPQRGGKTSRKTDGGKGAGPAIGEVVLQCDERGALKEIPAAALGPYPRGQWLDLPASIKRGER